MTVLYNVQDSHSNITIDEISSSTVGLVEARRVELLSENPSPQLSTSVAYLLTFPLRTADKQAVRFSSLKYISKTETSYPIRSPLI